MLKAAIEIIEATLSPETKKLVLGVTKGFLCHKYTYVSKKEADYILDRIAEKPQSHKKPVRSYECPKCGGWHHTSMTLEEFKALQNAQTNQ